MHINPHSIKTALLLVIIVFLAVFLSFSNPNSRQVSAQSSPDAIATRILPNDEHDSATAWYKKQGFKGSPQSIVVDGYDGVRDGRTVYVNAANIEAGRLYTNIYLISYNQKAEKATEDIFGQILSHWKFNSNITAIGACHEASSTGCLIDSECPIGDYCLSDKSKIVRDTNRLAGIAEMKILLNSYKETRNSFPKLTAGSYLSYKTISTWPSWQKTLAQELGQILPLDPINKLGDCGDGRFNPITCWDKGAKQFADSDLADPGLNLPDNSYAYVYSANDNGKTFSLCAVMESTYVTGMGSGACNGSASAISSVGSTGTNRPPYFVNNSINYGVVGQRYSGTLIAEDPDGDPISWSIDTSITPAWTDWSAAPIIRTVPSFNAQREVYAVRTGRIGNYPIRIRISDNRGGDTTQDFTINVVNSNPKINAANIDYVASQTAPLVYRLTATDVALSFPLTRSFIAFNPPPFATPLAGIPTLDRIPPTGDTWVLTFSGTPAANSIPVTTNYSSIISVGNRFGASSTKNFTITVINHAPRINKISSRSLTVGHNDLNTNPIVITAIDPENNTITYTMSGTPPAGVSGATVGNTFRIVGIPAESVQTMRTFPLTIEARDYFGAASREDFKITLINQPPTIDTISYTPTVRLYSTTNGSVNATDVDGHSIINFVISSPISSMSVTNAGGGIGNLSLTPLSSGSYIIRITAEDQYNSISAPKPFTLTVNSFCGDGRYNNPNMELKGGPLDNGNENCDCGPTAGSVLGGCSDILNANIATTPVNSSSLKQYACTAGCASPTAACTNTCTHTGGWCGDGIRQTAYGEGCDNTDNIATTPADSSLTRQYACSSTCLPAGGYCGDAGVQSIEVCEVGQTQACNTTFSTGFPSYCSGIPVTGIQTCNSTCDGWGACIPTITPTLIGNSSTACNTTNPVANNYSCCVLTACGPDACNCCGRTGGAPIPAGYDNVQSLGPDELMSPGCTLTSDPVRYPSFPGSCRMNRNQTNPENWQITTIHTTAYYQCWE